jgi:MOSC domain-containing protein YiiM
MSATVVALHLSKAGRQPLEPVARASVGQDRGIAGDRHDKPRNRRALLLMEQEVLDLFGLPPGTVREQVTVRGLPLMRLADGTRLAVGDAVLEVAHPCEPCRLMDEIRPGLRAELEDRRGRFVRVVTPGTFAVGDPITVLPPA